jgi:hypothetical protein
MKSDQERQLAFATSSRTVLLASPSLACAATHSSTIVSLTEIMPSRLLFAPEVTWQAKERDPIGGLAPFAMKKRTAAM